ncbi:hypothetical protein [Exiguobacterium sp. SH5S13]|uniref:sodium:solute symporter family transporter n=1 Tax=unclassified Exiguobacterium TaxID=2644629 RepID=UPI00351233E6
MRKNSDQPTSAMAWEVTAGIAAIIMALFLLPRFLGIGITTIPEFLSQRYDEDVRRLTVLLFLFGYMCVTIPSMLYSGGLAVLQLFDVPELLGISFEQSLWLVIWFIGIIRAIYAIFGGLRAVSVSDTLNGIGLIIIGFHVITYYFLVWGMKQWFGFDLVINFIHIYGILFVIETSIMLLFAKLRPMQQIKPIRIDLGRVKPWRHAISTSIILVASMVFVYFVFSPIGLAYADGIVSGWFWPATLTLFAATSGRV